MQETFVAKVQTMQNMPRYATRDTALFKDNCSLYTRPNPL